MKKVLLALLGIFCFEIEGFEYDIQFENDQICAAKAIIMPYEEIGLHRDVYPQVVVALKGGTITRLEANGQTSDVHFPTGVAVFRPSDPEDELHRSINNSSESIELIIIQLKTQNE